MKAGLPEVGALLPSLMFVWADELDSFRDDAYRDVEADAVHRWYEGADCVQP